MSTQPDMDLLALAGMTKNSLRAVDENSEGGNAHADQLDIHRMAGVQMPPRQHSNQPQRAQQRGKGVLGGYEFVDMPKSRPIGRMDLDGNELPPLPAQTMPEFIPVPEELRESVMAQVEHAPVRGPANPYSPQLTHTEQALPDITGEGFDLFQHAIVKQILDDLDGSITALEQSLESMKKKRKHIVKLIVGEKND